MTAPACREDSLRLTGSVGANRVMEAELLRLVKRSPFHVRVPKPRRDGDATLLYPFDPHVAWVGAVYHRTSSRIAWDLWSSPASRLEPLFEDLVPLVAAEDRLGAGPVRFSIEVRAAADFEAGPLQLRGVVKNALLEGLAKRGIEAELQAESPDVQLLVRRGGPDDERRTFVSLDLGGGARHVRGERVAMSWAPLRETLAAQVLALSRWDPRTEVLVDPMTGGGTIPVEAAHLATGDRVRDPAKLALGRWPAFAGLPLEAPPLFPGTVPAIACCDRDPAAVPLIIGNLRAAGLTGPARERTLVVHDADVRDLTPDLVQRWLPSADLERGVFAFNPPYGKRLAPEGGDAELVALYRDAGRALGRFRGWRASVFVANPDFADAFGHRLLLSKPGSNGNLRGYFHVIQL